jgi:hypothetical protein
MLTELLDFPFQSRLVVSMSPLFVPRFISANSKDGRVRWSLT